MFLCVSVRLCACFCTFVCLCVWVYVCVSVSMCVRVKRRGEGAFEGPLCVNADPQLTIGPLVKPRFCLSLSLHILLFSFRDKWA